ncbi:hypothetical protein B4U80_07426, partial [Leptotrombidium deliense]
MEKCFNLVINAVLLILPLMFMITMYGQIIKKLNALKFTERRNENYFVIFKTKNADQENSLNKNNGQ